MAPKKIKKFNMAKIENIIYEANMILTESEYRKVKSFMPKLNHTLLSISIAIVKRELHLMDLKSDDFVVAERYKSDELSPLKEAKKELTELKEEMKDLYKVAMSLDAPAFMGEPVDERANERLKKETSSDEPSSSDEKGYPGYHQPTP